MERFSIDRKKALQIGLPIAIGITALFGGSKLVKCLWMVDGACSKEPTSIQNFTDTNENSDENNKDASLTPNAIGHKVNEVGAKYEIVTDPLFSGRECVIKGLYSDDNKRTLYGMRAVLGDPKNPTDGTVYIYDNQKSLIGIFYSGQPATFAGMWGLAEPNAIACIDQTY